MGRAGGEHAGIIRNPVSQHNISWFGMVVLKTLLAGNPQSINSSTMYGIFGVFVYNITIKK
jgi:hypothetical protein